VENKQSWRLKDIFAVAATAAGLYIGASLDTQASKIPPSPAPAADVSAATLPASASPAPLPPTCIAASAPIAAGDTTETQRRLFDILRVPGASRTGQSIMAEAFRGSVRICMDSALDRRNACGFFRIGQYDDAAKTASLNPGISDALLTGTLIHEFRHTHQNANGISFGKRGNIPEQERILTYIAMEADSRINTVLFAHEMALQGNSAYINNLRDNSGYQPMLAAFERSLAEKPGNMIAAIQEGFLAFGQSTGLVEDYKHSTMNWITASKSAYDPARAADHILTERAMRALGSTPYGSYMTSSFIPRMRAMYTAQDHQAFIDKRQRQQETARDENKPAPLCG